VRATDQFGRVIDRTFTLTVAAAVWSITENGADATVNSYPLAPGEPAWDIEGGAAITVNAVPGNAGFVVSFDAADFTDNEIALGEYTVRVHAANNVTGLTEDVAYRFHALQNPGPEVAIDTATVPDATADFGALTRSGAGGFQIVDALGDPITGASDAGGGTATGYNISAGGIITPTSNGAFSAQDGATINVTCDQGSTTVTLNVIANAYSVRDITQLQTVAELSGLALGDQILLRPGSYNSANAGVRITRTAAPTGTWNGSNWVQIKPHDGAVAKLHRLEFYGTNVNEQYFEISDLVLVPDRFDANGNAAVIASVNGAGYIWIHDTTSEAPTYSETDTGDLAGYFRCNSSSPVGNIIIENNTWVGAIKGIVIGGPDCVIRGNHISDVFSDHVQALAIIPRLQVVGNVFTNKKYAYTPYEITGITRGNPTLVTVSDATGIIPEDDVIFFGLNGCEELEGTVYNVSSISGNELTVGVNSTSFSAYVSGGEARLSGSHGDFFQVVGAPATDGDLDDIVIRGNIMVRGVGTAGMPDGQGIFLADNSASAPFRNAIIEGNIISMTAVAGIAVNNPVNCTIRNNTVVGALGVLNKVSVSGINLSGTGSGNEVIDNVALGFTIGGSVTETSQSNNHTISDRTLSGYQAVFDNPPTGEVAENAVVQYAPKTGGALATATPVIGAIPHQDFDSPWTFTDPRFETPPAQFGAGDWSVLDLATSGDIRITITALPNEGGGDITDLEYQIDGGSWASLGDTVTGDYNIAGLTDDVEVDVALRAVNAFGNGTASAIKSVTPTAASSYAPVWVETNGTGYLTYANTAIANNARMTLVARIRNVPTTGTYVIWESGGGALLQIVNGKLDFSSFRDSAAAVIYDATSTNVVFSGEHTVYVALDLSVPSIDIRIDGSSVAMTVATPLVSGTGLFRLARNSGIFATAPGTAPLSGDVSEFFLEAGAIRAPTLFYDGGAKSMDGIGTPHVYLGGGMTADEFGGNTSQGWNDSYNRGSIAVTTASATFTD
jgi:parallel beta-helix repeat protein